MWVDQTCEQKAAPDNLTFWCSQELFRSPGELFILFKKEKNLHVVLFFNSTDWTNSVVDQKVQTQIPSLSLT